MTRALVVAAALNVAAICFTPLFAQTLSVNLTGRWKGTASDFWVNRSVTDGMVVTWDLTQDGSQVTGTVTSAPLVPNDGSCSSCHRGKSGLVSGTITGSSLSLTLDFPGKSGEITPHCSVRFTGTAASITDDSFLTSYSGVDSCEGPFTNGALTMSRQGTALSTTVHASGFNRPVAFVQDPTDRAVQFVVELTGRIRTVRNGAVLSVDFLDLRDAILVGGERGLLGMAFAPDYPTSGRFFVNFTDADGNTVVARFRRSSNPLVAEKASRFDLRFGGNAAPAVIPQPYENHNGGHLAFGPDGMLYIGLGDGGAGNDPEHRAQSPAELLGKMLRIDANVLDGHAIGYQVPADNPFVSTPGTRPEIWSFGLRNPWRYSFDEPSRGGTGALLIGDVGETTWEEINHEPAGRGGRNYGWRLREGAHPHISSPPAAFLPLTDPIHEYDRSVGRSVTGGYVYRGRALGTAAVGRFYFADFVTARVWSLALTTDPVTGEATASNRLEHTVEFGEPPGNISAFGLDADGELYLVSYSRAAVLKMTAAPTSPSILVHPASQTLNSGQTAQFSVVTSATPVPDYQWQVSSNGGASWSTIVDAAPYSGSTTATLAIASVPGALNRSRYRVVATNSAGVATSDPATLTVNGPMTASPTALHFAGTVSAGLLRTITPAQTVAVAFDGSPQSWTATTSSLAVRINTTGQTTGTGAGTFLVSIHATAVPWQPGTTNYGITITAPGVPNSPVIIPVTLTLTAAADTAPFGAFDIPASGATVAGSVHVSGWALDNVGVSRVELWRDRAAGETTEVYQGSGPGNGKIFIANAHFISGARPDVEAQYSTFPLANRTGWGYLMLTQGLWNQGNGALTLYAFAYDGGGNVTTLGSKSITATNSTATKPFGSIDTPAYGETVNGSFWNFGWALTPNATPSCVIPANGVQVSIDSGPLQPVTYGGARTDVAAAFPGLTNSNGAGGAYYIDTSTLSNGTHQIGWYVVDGCNRAEGVGSRFFTVLNQGSGTRDQGSGFGDQGSGSSVASPLAMLHSERRRVSIRQGERVEIALPLDGGVARGFHIVSGERRALPLGSSLDVAARMFYWEPAPGFLGAYDLEFAGESGGLIRMRAIVGTAVQAAIDTPRPGPVESAFTVAGWAIDEAATEGAGIDAVHVWAFPIDRSAPTFLGVASYGDDRPDIGALFGEPFARSSYSLSVNGLRPGTYDVVVYPHSAITGDFRGAKIVRITVP